MFCICLNEHALRDTFTVSGTLHLVMSRHVVMQLVKSTESPVVSILAVVPQIFIFSNSYAMNFPICVGWVEIIVNV